MLLKYTFTIETKINSKLWNENLSRNSSGTFYQTAENVKSTSDQYFPIFILILNENNEIVGQLTITVTITTVLYSSNVLRLLLKIIKKITTRGSWTYGPVIHSKNNSERIEILKTLLEAIDFVSKKYNLVFVEGDTSPYDNLIDETFKNELVKNGYQIQKRITFVANLNNDIETLWNNIHKNARGDVKRAEKNEIIIKKLETYDEIKDYLLLFQKWAQTKGLTLIDSSLEIEKLYKNSQNGYETFLLAYHNTELISALRISHFNKIAIANFVLSSYSESTSLGGSLLSWKALEWGKKNNMDYYDFTGGPFEALESIDKTQESSLLFYKKKWGGDKLIHYGITKPQKKFHYMLYKLLFTLIRSYHNFKSK